MNLDPAGENNPLGAMISGMLNNLMPITAPADTSMVLPTYGNVPTPDYRPTDAMTRALIDTISAQGSAGFVPWRPEIDDDFAEMMPPGMMAYVDASAPGTTAEQLNDMIFEKWHMAAPWDDGSEQAFTQYMPIFRLKVDYRNMAPGFVPLADPALINQMQAQLLKAERNTKLAVAMGAANRGNWRALLPTSDPNDKMRRLVGGTSPFDRVRFQQQDRVAMTATEKKIETLRFFAATSVNELWEKIDFLGPITQIFEANGPKPRMSSNNGGARGGRPNHRLVSTSWHNRGKINNCFATDPHEGDGLYFKLAHFSRDELSQLSVESGVARNIVGTKRGYGDKSYVISPHIGSRADTSDSFLQIRGFSSREQREFMGDSTGIDDLKPAAGDRLYAERSHRAALEWREYIYDPDTRQMRERDLLGQEGEQEVRENAVTSVVLDNYLTAAAIIRVGAIKEKINKSVNEQAILNAHYDHQAMTDLPHFDIYQNHTH